MNPIVNILFILMFLHLIMTTNAVIAETSVSEKPLMELGVGALYTRIYDYPGSDRELHLVIPFPVGTYRGSFLRSGRDEGLRGRLLRSESVELGMNYDGSFSLPGRKNPDREGMEPLQTVGELGPAITLTLWKWSEFELSWLSGYRKAFNTNFKSMHDRGYALGSQLHSDYTPERFNQINLDFKFGLKYANRSLMSYYYGVRSSEVTEDRPFYEARAGLMYVFATFSVVASVTEHLSLFSSVIVFSFHHASNRRSPLMKRIRNDLVSVGFVYSLYQSEEKGWN